VTAIKIQPEFVADILVLFVSTTIEAANIRARKDTRASANFHMHKGSVCFLILCKLVRILHKEVRMCVI